MEAIKETIVQIHITLDQKEAICLKHLAQNYLDEKNKNESTEECIMIKRFLNMLSVLNI